MTGKEYLVDYIQNHNAEEIYDLLRNIQDLTHSYTDSRGAFIGFLEGDSYVTDFIFMYLKEKTFAQSKDGQWILMQGENE